MTLGTIYWIGFVLAWYPIGFVIFEYIKEESGSEANEITYLWATMTGFLAMLVSLLWFLVLPAVFLGMLIKRASHKKDLKAQADE